MQVDAKVSKMQAAEAARRFRDTASVVTALQPSYPVYCLRPEVLQETARRFVSQFPGTVLYAVKCNPHPLVLKALHAGGIRHFDTASLAEIAQVAETFSDSTSYFMHPVKARPVIKAAYQVYGVRTFVVDHVNELRKVFDETGAKDITVVVRIDTPKAADTLYHLSAKFGCKTDDAAALLKEAHAKGCKTGIAFHVGSQCRTPDAYRVALDLVGQTIEKAGVKPACVDVGGGFPADYINMKAPPLEAYMEAIRQGAKAIRLGPNTELFAEPGRALVATGCSLLLQIQLRKEDRLYVNDGIYGSLSEMVVGGLRLPARLIRIGGEAATETRSFVLNGPTCDSADVLPGTFQLPADATEGDWIEVDLIGAYSNANATHFNGFYPETFVEVFDDGPGAGL